MQSVLYGINVYDAPSLLTAVGVLAAIALIATTIPTLRIARIDPAKTLREE
jgi:ABC-type lipoprotein release transport system permease subunit